MAKDIRLISGRIQTKAIEDLDTNRSNFISLDNAEPNLGAPDVDDKILGSLTDGTRKWITTSGDGIRIGTDNSGNTQLEVNEETLPIEPADLYYSASTNLKDVLDDLDSALQDIATIAQSGTVAIVDSANFNGDGTVTSPITFDSTLEIGTIDSATRIVADSIGKTTTLYRGDGRHLTNLPIDSDAIDSLARNALTGGIGITYTASSGTIDIDSNDNNIVLSALTVKNNVSITGDLTVSGDLTTVNQSQLAIDDALIQLGVGNEVSDAVDIGFVGHYRDASLGPVHTGLFRDASPGDKGYYLFHEYIDSNFDTGTPPTTIDRSHSSFALANLNVATLDAVKGDFDSVVISGNLTITTGDIIATNSKITVDSAVIADADITNLDATTASFYHIDSVDSMTVVTLAFTNLVGVLDSDNLPENILAGAVDSIDSERIPDLFLRNDGDDTTTGTITAAGFRGNIESADSANIVTLSGTTATFTTFNGALSGNATSATQLQNTRTFNVTGDVTTAGGAQNFNGTQNVILNVSLNQGVVDTLELADSAVTTAKIDDNAVTADKIAPNAVDSDIDLRVTKAFIDALNVDADTLDSLNSLQFLRSDAPDNVEANLTWLDNIQARFGTGGDLKIYHDGTNSYIKDEGTGDLYILTNGQEVLIKDSASGKLSAEFIPDSAVDLYYNGNLKFETKNTGVKVTGIIEADSGTLNGSRILTTADEGAGNGLDADTLDGLQSTEFLRSNADDSMAGTLHIDDSLSANNITRRNSPVVAGTYGSQIAIPIITVDSSGFLDSVGTVAVDGVDSIQYNDTTGVLTVFTGSGTSLTDSITLDPFSTADLTEDSTALYYTDSRADSAARNAFTVTNTIAPGFNTGSNPYGLTYTAATGVWSYNGIDSATILSVVGGSSGGGTGGTSGGTTDLTLNSIKVDSAEIYEYLSVGRDTNGGVVAGNQVYFEHIDSVDSAFINVLDVTIFSFDSIPNDGTSIVPLYALPSEVVSAGTDGNIDSDQIPDLFLRNDESDSTTGSITADGGFVGNLTGNVVGDINATNGSITTLSGTGLDYDSGDIATLTGLKATFDSLFGEISGTYIDSGTIANDRLVNSKVVLSDGSNTQDVNLGETFTIAGGTDINVSVGATRTATVSNASTLHSVTGRGDSTSNAVTFGNITTTGYVAGPSTFTIDPAGVGDNTGTVVIAGNLQVDGTTTTINSTEITVNDKTLTLADSSPNGAGADSAGLIIDLGTDGVATWLYKDSDTSWNANLGINAPWFSGSLSADDLDSGEVDSTRLPAYLQSGGSGQLGEGTVPDVFLRNDSDDSTTGSITADGGFIGNLTGNASTADSATQAGKWTTARTVTFATGEVTGSFSIDGSGDVGNVALTIANDAVDLTTQTQGNYVASLSAGFGIAFTGSASGEGTTPTIRVDSSSITGLFSGGTGVTITGDSISIGQDVSTTADVTFGKVTADSVVANNIINIGETTTRDKLTIGGASSNDLFGLTFVDPTTATSGGHISYRDSNNTVTIGTITSSVKSHGITVATSGIGIFNDNPGKELDVTGEIRASGTITSSTGFSGDGSGLSALNASNLLTGTVPSARIAGNYTGITGVGALDAGSITSNFGNINIGTSTVTASGFAGSGASLTNLNATQLTSGTIANSRISGDYTGITGVGSLALGNIDSDFGNINIGTSIFTGDGSGLFNVDADTIGGVDPEELSKTVVLTDSDNGTGPAGTGYYYRIANLSLGTDADATFLYAIMPDETTYDHAGATIVSVQIKKSNNTDDHTANIDILGMGGSIPFNDNAFRLINLASTSTPQLWMQANIAGVRLKVVEISAHNTNVTVNYNNKNSISAWQSGTPSGTGTAVVSAGLKYRGFDVFHQGASVDSATLNNPTITGDVTLGQVVTYDDGNTVAGNTETRTGSEDNNNSSATFTLDTLVAADVIAGKYVIVADRYPSTHLTEINFISTTEGNTVQATEFGTIYSSNPLFSVDMDISGTSMRLRITPSSNSFTTFKFQGTVFYDA